MVVVEGKECPCSNDLMHCSDTMHNHYKVFVNKTRPNFHDVDLHIPSLDGMTTNLGIAKGHFLMWPIEQVNLEKN